MSRATLFICAAMSSSILASCGGSGSGDGQSPFFVSFSSVPDDGITQISGSAVTADFTEDPATMKIAVGSVSDPGDATATVTTVNGESVALAISASGSSVSFDTRSGDTREDMGSTVQYTKPGEDTFANIADPEDFGFEYQTFGQWVEQSNPTAGTIGVGSFGSKTPVGNMPSVTANYSGASVGFVTATDGTPFITSSTIGVSTDFSTASISSTGTSVIDVTAPGQPRYDVPFVDFAGSGPVSGSGFSAAVSGTAVSGNANGQFYGPNAEEVGGTFSTTGPGGVPYVGSFGAKRP